MNANCNSEFAPNDGDTVRVKQIVERKEILEKQQVLLIEKVRILKEALTDVLISNPILIDGEKKTYPSNSCPLSVYIQDRIDMNSTAIEEINYILDHLEI